MLSFRDAATAAARSSVGADMSMSTLAADVTLAEKLAPSHYLDNRIYTSRKIFEDERGHLRQGMGLLRARERAPRWGRLHHDQPCRQAARAGPLDRRRRSGAAERLPAPRHDGGSGVGGKGESRRVHMHSRVLLSDSGGSHVIL
jgi:hypothetical protein